MFEDQSFKKYFSSWDEKFAYIQSLKEGNRYNAILDYLYLVKSAYENGLIGYMEYPQNVVSLYVLTDLHDYPELDEVFSHASYLDVPYQDGRETNPRTRLQDTEKLTDLIEALSKADGQVST